MGSQTSFAGTAKSSIDDTLYVNGGAKTSLHEIGVPTLHDTQYLIYRNLHIKYINHSVPVQVA